MKPAAPLFRIIATCSLGCALLGAAALAQQVQQAQQQIQVIQGGGQILIAPQGSDEENVGPSAAMLESNADADALLNRAREYMQDQKYREALLLLQAATDRYGQYLAEDEQGVYLPTRRLVERLLSRWAAQKPDLLEQYRLAADPEARGLLGGPVDSCVNLEALKSVVERFFLSSEGDDAAFRLACLHLDRGEDAQAAMLLTKILQEYPKSTVDIVAVHARLAMAHAQLGSRVGLEQSLAALAASNAPMSLRDQLQAHWASRSAVRTEDHSGPWQMAWGNPSRCGLMSSLPLPADAPPSSQWAQLWRLSDPKVIAQLSNGPGMPSISRGELIQQWTTGQLRPASQAAFSGDVMYARIGQSLLAIDTLSGELLWRIDPDNQAASVSREQARMNAIYGMNYGMSGIAQTELFGDRRGRSLTLHEDVLYYLDAPPMLASPYARQAVVIINGRRMGTAPQGQLIAMDLASRKVRWRTAAPSRLEAADQPEAQQGQPIQQFQAGGAMQPGATFTASPIPLGKQLLITIWDEGELHLASLSPEDGKLLWRKFLCSAPEGYDPPWAATGLSLQGQTVYIATGLGLLVAADAHSGQVLWASRYPRVEIGPDRYGRVMIGSQAWVSAGQPWDDNAVFGVGGALVLTAADSPQFHIFDKLTGELRSSITPLRRSDPTEQYVLGVKAGRLFVAGRDELACFDAQSGELMWRSDTPGSTGRALLTEDAIFATTGSGIVRIDPQSGKWASRIEIDTSVTGPIGNLYSNGRHLLSLGIDGVAALGDVDQEFDRLRPLVAQGQGAALYQRARLYEQLDQHDKAIVDLRAALSGLDEPARTQAAGTLVLSLLAQAQKKPSEAMAMLDEAAKWAQDEAHRAAVSLAKAQHLIRTQKFAEASELYLQYAAADGALMVSVDPREPGWKIASQELGAWGLRELAKDGGKEVQALLEDRAAAAHGSLPAGAELAQAWSVARAYPSTSMVNRMIRQMGQGMLEGAAGDFAQRQAWLEEMERLGDGANSAAASMMLARVYEQRGWYRDAAAQWRSLERRSAEVGLDALAGAPSAGSVAGDQLKALASKISAQRDPRRLDAPPTRPLWYSHAVEQQMLTLGSGDALDHNQHLLDRVLLYSPGLRRITCRDPSDGWKAAWSARLPDDLEQTVRRTSQFIRAIDGGVDGNVLVVLSPSRSMAIDLISGQTLWEQETSRPAAAHLPFVSYRARVMQVPSYSVGSGVVAEIATESDGGQEVVKVRDLISGQLLWSRSPEHDVIHGLWVRGPYVIVALNNGSTIWLCDRRTGQKLRELSIENSQNHRFFHMSEEGVLFQAAQSLHFMPYDSNQERWVKGADRRSGIATVIYPISDRLILAAWSSGEISVLEIRTGQELWGRDREQIGRLMDASLGEDGRLYLLATDERNRLRLEAVDVLSGEAVQTVAFSNLLGMQQFPAEDLAAAGPTLPFVERDLRSSSRFVPVLYDRAQGKELVRLSPPPGYQFDRLVQPPRIRSNCLIFTTQSGMMAFGPEDQQAAPIDPADAAEPAAVQQEIPDVTVNNGRIEIRTPGGGVIRAGNRIVINGLEFRRNGDVIEIYKDGKLIERRPAGQPVDLNPVPVPPAPPAPQEKE